MKNLSIIVVNWNTKDLLLRCLNSIVANVQSLDCEVIVVDNGSTDGSVDMVRDKFPAVILIENQENLGFAKANNQAIRISLGKYILLLNSDAFITFRVIQKMIYVMENELYVGIIGPNLILPNGKKQLSHGSLPSLSSEIISLFGLDRFIQKFKGLKGNQTPQYTGYVVGACMLIRRLVFEQIGLLDEHFFMFSEEVDFCYRANKAGWKIVYLPFAKVVHVSGGSTGVTENRLFMLYKSKLEYFGKHFGYKGKKRLMLAIISATRIKIGFYTLLHLLSFGFFQKDERWSSFSKSLPQLQKFV